MLIQDNLSTTYIKNEKLIEKRVAILILIVWSTKDQTFKVKAWRVKKLNTDFKDIIPFSCTLI